MSEKENVKEFPNGVGAEDPICSGCQKPKSKCICVEGFHTLNNGWHIKKQITSEELEDLFLSSYGVYKNGLLNSEGKVVKIGTDKEGSYYFGAKHYFIKKVLQLTLKEYEDSKFYEYQAMNLIGFQNGILTGTIPQILPAIHSAYSWYLDLIHTDLTLSGQLSQFLNKGLSSIKELIEVFSSIDSEKINNLMENFNQAKEQYQEITGQKNNTQEVKEIK